MEPDYRHKWKVLFVISLGIFMSTLDGSILNIANPVIAEEFSVNMTSIQWIVTIYMLVITATLMFFGRLGDKWGGEKLYNQGFLIFVIGSVFCALSPNLILLVLSRAFQAIGSSMLMATGMGIVSNSFPENEKGKAFGITGAVVGIGNMSGPILGGLLLARFEWPIIFLINIPIGLYAFWMGKKYLPAQPKNEAINSFDMPGMILFSVFTTALLLSLNAAETITIGQLIFIGIIFISFFVWEKTTKESLLDFSLFAVKRFSLGNMMSLLAHTAQMGILFLLPFYMKNVLDFTPAYSGLILTTSPLAMALIAPIAGSWSDKFGSKKILLLAFSITTTAYVILTYLTVDNSILILYTSLILLGLGMGAFGSPNNSDILKSIPPEKAGYAGGFSATVRNFAFVIGIAFSSQMLNIFVRIYEKQMSYQQAYTLASSNVYKIIAALSFLGLILALFIPAKSKKV